MPGNFTAAPQGYPGADYPNYCVPAYNQQVAYGTCDPQDVTAEPADPSIYDRAISIGPPRFKDNEMSADAAPLPNIRRKVVRQVTVPFTRKVKVPVKTTKIVPTVEPRRVKTTKLVQVPSWQVVDEEYTEFEEREAVRDKEVWVKKIVPERYIERVPVKKVRQVRKPTTEVKEVEDFQVVPIRTNKVMEVDGFRVDEVEDHKVVEVEELQNYELRPVAVGPASLYSSRDLGRVPGMHAARSIGNEVYSRNSRNVACLDEDSNPGDTAGITMSSIPQGRFAANAPTAPAQAGPPGPAAYAPAQGTLPPEPLRNGMIGCVVMNTHTRHTDGTGVVVTKVNNGGPAEAAGLRTNDIITHVHNQPTPTVADFRNVVSRVPGPLRVQVNRDGRQGVKLTIYR